MALVRLEQPLKQDRVERGGRAMRPPRLIGQTWRAEGAVARQELVPGLPADAIGSTQLGDRHDAPQGVLNELLTELHGDHLLPRHRSLLEEPETWR